MSDAGEAGLVRWQRPSRVGCLLPPASLSRGEQQVGFKKLCVSVGGSSGRAKAGLGEGS